MPSVIYSGLERSAHILRAAIQRWAGQPDDVAEASFRTMSSKSPVRVACPATGGLLLGAAVVHGVQGATATLAPRRNHGIRTQALYTFKRQTRSSKGQVPSRTSVPDRHHP
jgi:hypothetical protein